MPGAKKMLLVDDEENMRKAIVRLMRENFPSVEVIEAGTSEDALKAVKIVIPDLILLDVLMPGMNGLAVLKTIKDHTDKRIRSIPIFMLTGVGNMKIALTSKKMGAIPSTRDNETVFGKSIYIKIKKIFKIEYNFIQGR